MEHAVIPLGQRHALHNWEVESVEALAALTVSYADVGKAAYVQGLGLYTLRSVDPITFASVGNPVASVTVAGGTLTITLADGTELTEGVAPADLGAEPALPSAGSSPETKYLNGNKTWTVLTKAAWGLDQVDNTSDANKPVSTAQATAILAAQNYAVQRSNHTGTQLAATISDFSTAVGLAAPVKTVNGATGDVSVTTASIGAVATSDIGVTVAPLTAGKIPSSYLPAIAISDYLGSVASQAAMLALVGERGDWCTRSDTSQTYILTNESPSVLAS